MDEVRSPVVAGSFYPGSADRLGAEVDRLLASTRAWPGPAVHGIVVPHAGYPYSGPVAASAYACLAARAAPARIVIAGPSHFVALRGLAVTAAGAWRTPLGDVAIDEAGRDALVAAGAVVDDAPHRSEHSLEVQLPFLQRCCPGVPALPVTVGQGSPDEAARVLRAALGDEAVLVVSTDLSHYHDAATARRLDTRTAAAVEALDPAAIGADDACGADPLRAAMAWARALGHRIELLDLRNSADTAGDPGRVVGYGAFAIVG
jgi:AmmeMemoRadiSam system protein B